MRGVGLIDIGSLDLGEMLAKTVSAKDLKAMRQGKSLKVARAKTKSARDKDGASQGSGIVKEATRRDGCLNRMGFAVAE